MRPEFIQEPDEVERLLQVMTAANPMVDVFFGIPKGPDGRLDRSRLENAVRFGFMIIRWHLEKEVRGL